MPPITRHRNPACGASHDVPATGALAITLPMRRPHLACGLAPDVLPGPRRAPFTRDDGKAGSHTKGRDV